MSISADIAAWRTEVNAWHPLPVDSHLTIQFMVTEAAECLDAAIRQRFTGLDRTRAKQYNLGRELAQVVELCYTAAAQEGLDLDAAIEEWLDVVRRRNPHQ